jgi:hypothetical protein
LTSLPTSIPFPSFFLTPFPFLTSSGSFVPDPEQTQAKTPNEAPEKAPNHRPRSKKKEEQDKKTADGSDATKYTKRASATTEDSKTSQYQGGKKGPCQEKKEKRKHQRR